VFYTWWNGENWSKPIDILASSTGDGLVQAKSITTTRDGRVVIAWVDQSEVLVSYARIGDASTATAWTTKRLGVGTSARLAIDDERSIWNLAFESDAQVLIISSQDDGCHWGEAQVVWSAQTEQSAPVTSGVYVGRDGGVHAVWTENVERRSWQGEAIWHAYRLTANPVGFEVREVARSVGMDEPTLGSPVMAIGKQGDLHLFWNNGVGSKTGRFHQYSDDNGATWSETSAVFPGLSGQTDRAGLALDSDERLHLITSADGDGLYQCIRYATWVDGNWSGYENLWCTSDKGEFPSLTLTGGNRLHLVWTAFRLIGDNNIVGEVMYTSRLVDARAENPPGFSSRADLCVTLAPDVKTFPNIVTSTVAVTPTSASAQPSEPVLTLSDPVSESLDPVLVGVFGAAFVVFLGVVYSWLRNR
jgi:hypothetical protein